MPLTITDGVVETGLFRGWQYRIQQNPETLAIILTVSKLCNRAVYFDPDSPLSRAEEANAAAVLAVMDIVAPNTVDDAGQEAEPNGAYAFRRSGEDLTQIKPAKKAGSAQPGINAG